MDAIGKALTYNQGRRSVDSVGGGQQGPIERVRGMADVLPAERAFRAGIAAALERHFAAHGYRALDTPVVEATELFLRKSGEERAAQMYAFDYRNRQIALRPEFTASIVRAYVAELQGLPLPLRLSYCGPVFRYEKPQAGRSRQYTEAGVELLGAAGPAADAEVIHLALSGLEVLGLDDCALRLGHLGAVGAFLASLPLDERVRDWFLWSMERLRTQGDAGLHRNLRAMLAPVGEQGARDGIADAVAAPNGFPALDDLLQDGADEERARALMLGLLHGAGVELAGSSRSPEEIVERLLVKLRRPRVAFDVAGALGFLRRLVALRGEPDAVLRDLRALLADYALDAAPVGDLEEVLALLRAYGHRERITLDLGLGAGCTTTPASSSRSTTARTRRRSSAAAGATTTWRRCSARARPCRPPASPAGSSGSPPPCAPAGRATCRTTSPRRTCWSAAAGRRQ